DDNSIAIDENDPLYARGEDLYGNDDDDDNDNDAAAFREDQLPPAFREDPLLRRAYVQAFVSATFHGTTKDGISHFLTSMRSNYASMAQRCPAAQIPGLDKMAVTLRTVERCLGVDPDQRITYFFLCDKCWYRHHPSELYKLGHSSCAQPGCSGTLYDVKTLSDGKKRRRPTRILPTTSLKQELQRILLRPGKPTELNAWRQEHDKPGHKGPIPQEDWPGSHDPNFRMQDMFDGWGWNAVMAGLQRRRGGRWEVEDVDVDDLQQRFVALPMGLILMFNIDWYRGKYSVGAIYATICNNPRAKRFLLEETILVAIIPGPDEPSLEQLNSVLEPFVLEARQLYSGKCVQDVYPSLHPDGHVGSLMKLAGEKELSPVHVNVCILASDLPASRKTTGLKGHTSKLFMCPVCKKPFHSLVDEKCYDPENFDYRSEGRYLKYAFRARFKDQASREEIANRRGIRWSILNLLPGWWPASNGPPDKMHAAYLGEAKHVMQNLLYGSGMFTKRNSKDKPEEKFNEFLESVWWPGDAGRVPSGVHALQITSGAAKADEFRNLCTVLAVALYVSWQKDGEIPDEDAPSPSAREKLSTNKQRVEGLVNQRRHANAADNGDLTTDYAEYIDNSKMDRNYSTHYTTVLLWLVSLRIFGSRSITVQESNRAANFHSWACRAWARMRAHLTPYFHLLSHLTIWIHRLGPVYAWWTYPYERFNGFLSRVRHNGHPGELEATMMRMWMKVQLIYDLILHLESLGDEQTNEDRASIADLRKYLQSHKQSGKERGTLLTMLASMSAEDGGELVRYPAQSQKATLHREDLYLPVFSHLRDLWQDKFPLITETAPLNLPGARFTASDICSYAYVTIAGVRYGTASTHRGKKYMYGYINGREAVRIERLLRVSQYSPAHELMTAHVAIVRAFIPSPHAAEMPWNIHATDLGIDTWKGAQLGPPQVINMLQFSGHFALALVPYRLKQLWVTMSLCHVNHAI
ncbi:hypothetical protein C8T65DRAFT_538235, partial [Cerioporus squamosus]